MIWRRTEMQTKTIKGQLPLLLAGLALVAMLGCATTASSAKTMAR